jgi:hypothetical protein
MSSLRWLALFVAAAAFAVVTFLPGVTTRAVDRVDTEVSGATAVTVLLREEDETRILRGPRRMVPRLESLTRWSIEIAGNDVGTAQPRWWRWVATTYGRAAAQRAKILAVDGDRVWILADQLYGVDATTGEVVVDNARLEAAAPVLRGLIPTEPKYFERAPKSGALIVTAADGRVWCIDATTLAATPRVDEFTPTEMREWTSQMAKWSMQLAIGTGPDDFKVNGDVVGDRWVGMIADEETKDVTGQWSVPSRSSSTPRRRRLWRARVAYSDSIIMGRTAQISDPIPVDGAAEFLTGGLLRHGDRPVPVQTADPEGFLVLHTDRLGEDGRYLLSRIDAEGRPRWTDALPLKRIQEVFATDRSLVLIGPERRPDDIRGATLLVAFDLASGRCGVFDFRTAAMLPGDCAS